MKELVAHRLPAALGHQPECIECFDGVVEYPHLRVSFEVLNDKVVNGLQYSIPYSSRSI